MEINVIWIYAIFMRPVHIEEALAAFYRYTFGEDIDYVRISGDKIFFVLDSEEEIYFTTGNSPEGVINTFRYYFHLSYMMSTD